MVKMPHWPKPFGRNFIDLKLERVKTLLDRLGNPEKKLPPVIHVAGTNGKGSTIAFLKAILNSAGYKVHQYTSPHLIRFNERIVIANEEITDKQLFETMEECRVHGEGLKLTIFEATTAGAFLAFSKHPADVVLLETGLGGRLDATNVMENILLSIITPISYDHMEFLGDSLLEIAGEKAGIIKNNSRCIISWQESAVLNFMIQKCEQLNCKSYAWQRDWNFSKTQNGFSFLELSSGEEFTFPNPILNGIHQIVNASTAIAAVRLIADKFSVDNNAIKEGLMKAYWPARMQKIQNGTLASLLPKNCEIWLDGAHNTAGAQMIAATLDTLPIMPTFLINGRTRDRDIEGFLMCFLGKVEHVIAVPVEWEPHSENPVKIRLTAEKIGINATLCDSLVEAIEKCAQLSKGRIIRVLICGSLYLAGDVLEAKVSKSP
jgi:dihydrofolate synthase/folylpolyglutamate synthase